MYKGKGWKILLPKARPRIYTTDSFVLERAPQPQYDAETQKLLEKARQEAVEQAKERGDDLRPGKLIGFEGVEERGDLGVARIRQLDYITFAGAAKMVEAGDKGAGEYGSNLGVMTTVKTTDGKFLFSVRRPDIASWGSYHSLFGCGLTGEENGDADKIVETGTRKVCEVMMKRVLAELDLREEDIVYMNLLGLVEGDTYKDHIVSFDTLINAEAEKILREKQRILARDVVSKKYSNLFAVDGSSQGLADHVLKNEHELLEVAKGGLVLTAATERANNLRGIDFESALLVNYFMEREE